MLRVLLILVLLPGAVWATEVRSHSMVQHENRERITYVYSGPQVFFGPSSAEATLYVDDRFVIDSVRVMFSINHTWDGDVRVTVVTPAGNEDVLVNSVGGGDDNFLQTQFDDAATQQIMSASAPYTGTYLPAQPLYSLHGDSTQGVWRLRLEDSYPNADDGTLTEWTLTVVPFSYGYVWGRVVSMASGQPLAGVRVETNGGQFTFTSDSGRYSLRLSDGTFYLHAQLADWCTSPYVTIQLEDGDSLETTFALRRSQLTLNCSSLNTVLAPSASGTDTLRVENAGDCDLVYSIMETVPWLDATFLADTLGPARSRSYLIGYHAVALTPGDHQAMITIHHNGAGTPYQLPVYVFVWPVSDGAEPPAGLPAACRLVGNYPNPFNGETRILYTLPQPSSVQLELYNLRGQRMAVLAEGWQAAGYHSARWDGAQAASGVYFVRLTAGDYSAIQRLHLVR